MGLAPAWFDPHGEPAGPRLPCGQMVQFALLIAPYMGGPAPMSAASLGTCGLPVLDWVEGVGDGPTDRFAVEGDACLEVG